MNANLEETNRDAIAAQTYKKWVRSVADADMQQVRALTQRVAELEGQIDAGQKPNLNWRLAEAESRLANCIAAARQAAQRLSGEHAVSRLLAESVEFTDAASKILQAICQSLNWDVGAFWMHERDSDALQCIEFWHAPTVEVSGFEQVLRRSRFSRGIGLPGRIWASGSPAWIPDVTQDIDFPAADTAAQGGLHAAVGFPIHNGAEFLGIMEFFSREIRQPDEGLLEMMSCIGSNISGSIERGRGEELLRQQEFEQRLARQIQEGLLPQAMPASPDLSLGGRSWPSQMVGGDYFDFFHMSDGCLGIAIGDASGHGMGAALMIVETRAFLRALALTSTDLNAILTLTNHRLVEDLDHGQFVTLLLARLNPRTRSLVYAGAGHCAGYVLDQAGRTKATLHSEGFPLGLDASSDFPVSPAMTLAPGDLIYLHSDGIVEAHSGASGLFGIERALSIVREHRRETPARILDALFAAVRDFSQPHGQMDDVTAVIIKVEPMTFV